MRKWYRVTAVLLLLLLWGRLLSTTAQQSATFDESIHILQGALTWQSWKLFSVVQNPPLINTLIGLPVQLLLRPTLPPFDSHLIFQDWLALSQQFVWQTNDNGLQIIWAGRWAIVALTLLLAALVTRFARQLFHCIRAGLLALLLLSFEPNILAHGALATTDLGIAFFLTLAVYAVWRYWQGNGGGWRWVATAVALGLAFSAKFSAIILIPALYLLLFYRAFALRQTRREFLRALLSVTGWVGVGLLVLLLLYRGQGAALAFDFQMQQAHQFTGHSAFLHGETQVGGWWYYFPIALFIKTPIATLLLIVVAFVVALRRGKWRDWSLIWLLLPAAAILGAGLLSQVNIGYRYLLPMLPLLFTFTSLLAVELIRSGVAQRLRQGVLSLALLGVVAASFAIHPHYLAYFNGLVGGPANGWRWLVDSNLDWGQDIGALAAYEGAHLPQPYQVAWLGSAPLAAYGVQRGQAMPIWPHGREDPLHDPFYPPLPSAGQYVLSATQLRGVYLQNPARFAWFQEREPVDRIGYSLFVYDVPPTGPAVGLGLAGIGPAMIASADYAIFQSNDVTPRWFDARASLLWPGGDSERVWTAVGEGHLPTHPLLTQFYPAPMLTGVQELDGRLWQYRLYAWDASPFAELREETVVGDPVSFLGHQLVPGEGVLHLLTVWRVTQTPAAEVKIYTHLLDVNRHLVAQHDGLDVAWHALQPGDEFAQLHPIPLPPDLPPGQYTLQIGLYRAEDGVRLGEAVSLPEIGIP